jgi:hypothetical protein
VVVSLSCRERLGQRAIDIGDKLLKGAITVAQVIGHYHQKLMLISAGATPPSNLCRE